MAGLVDSNQLLDGNVRIFLRRGKAFVAQQLLDGAQIRPRAEHMGRKAVPQRMRVNLQSLGELADMMIHEVSHASGRQSSSSNVQKHGLSPPVSCVPRFIGS